MTFPPSHALIPQVDYHSIVNLWNIVKPFLKQNRKYNVIRSAKVIGRAILLSRQTGDKAEDHKNPLKSFDFSGFL